MYDRLRGSNGIAVFSQFVVVLRCASATSCVKIVHKEATLRVDGSTLSESKE